MWSPVLDRFNAALLSRLHRTRDPEPADDMLVASTVTVFERCVYLAVSTPDGVLGRSDDELADTLASVWVRSLLGP